jgi:cytochrome c peroxidase
MRILGKYILITLAVLAVVSCGGNAAEELSSECDSPAPTVYSFNLPDHFPSFNVPANNLTTEQGVAMGRSLYYDKKLSIGGPLSGRACASCHNQSISFTVNVVGTAVLLHTNLNWSSYFLWNGGISGGLEEAMQFEIADFFKSDLTAFKSDPMYQEMNCRAFGSNDVTLDSMSKALAQWMRTLVSSDSRYDRYLLGKEELTLQERRGLYVFNSELGDCFKCHTLPLTTDNQFHNNGLEAMPTGVDQGRRNVTDDPADNGRFKTPTLRNIELTAPYMHDGRFKTLEEVVAHYDGGVQWSPTLDPVMQFSTRIYGLGLGELDKAALVAFLKTLTDEKFISDPKLASPFQ